MHDSAMRNRGQNVLESDQEIAQPHTADQTMAAWGTNLLKNWISTIRHFNYYCCFYF